MNDSIIFIWGLVATILATGPLSVAAYLDWKDKESRRSDARNQK